jgi:hypothetical protein
MTPFISILHMLLIKQGDVCGLRVEIIKGDGKRINR